MMSQVHEMVANASLNFVDYSLWTSRLDLRPETHLTDPRLLDICIKKNTTTQVAGEQVGIIDA